MAKEFFKNLPDETTPFEAERFNDLFDGGESLGSIVVDDVNCKNKLSLYNITDFNTNSTYNNATDISNIMTWKQVYNNHTSLLNCHDNYLRCKKLVSYDTHTAITFKNLKPNTTYTLSCIIHVLNWAGVTGFQLFTLNPKKVSFIDDKLEFTRVFTTNENGATGSFYSNYITESDGTTTTGFEYELLDFMIEEGDKKTNFIPHKKYGYNSQESIGNIIVDNIKSKNLFNKYLFNTFTDSLQYLDLILEPNTTYTMSSNLPAYSTGTYTNLFFVNNGETLTTDVNGVFPNKPRTLTTDATGKVQIAYRDGESALNDEINKYWFQIEKGSIATENTTFKNFEMLNPIEIITPTIDWTKIAQASAYKAYKIGNIAFLVLTCKITATIGNTDVLATGLPKPFTQVGFYANSKNLIINTNGELVNNYSSLSNIGWLHILVCYPCQS